MVPHGFTPRAPSRRFAVRRRARAFTLLELLVAAAITAAMAGFIAVVVSNVAGTWARSTGRLEADAQARLALDQIALDLQGAIYRDDGNVWLAANILDTTANTAGLWVTAQTPANAKPAGTATPSSLVLNTASIADARFGLAGTWLRFFTSRRGANTATTAITIADTLSAPVAVGYQIVRRRTSAAALNQNTAYSLHRAEARPGSNGTRPGVLDFPFNLTDPAYTTSTSTTNTGAITGDPRSVRIPGSLTNLDSIIADNVIDFGLRAYVRSPANGTLVPIFPVTALGPLGGNAATALRSSLPPTATVSTANRNQLFPEVVDVMLRVLTDEGARLIANLEKSPPQPATFAPKYASAAAQWWAVALANSRVYTRRVVLVAQPL